MQGLYPACCALLDAANGRASPKPSAVGESWPGPQHMLPILFHHNEARSVKESILSLGAGEKTPHCPAQTV